MKRWFRFTSISDQSVTGWGNGLLSIFRFLRNLREGEHNSRVRFGRGHPRFFLFLGIDAVLTMLIVSSAYALAIDHYPLNGETHQIVDFGGAAMNLQAVMSQARKHAVTFYWIGPEGTKKFATEVDGPDSVTLRYLHETSAKPNFPEQFLSIETYADEEKFSRALRGPIQATPGVQTYNSRGDWVTFNRSDLSRAVIALANSTEFVILRYSNPQNEKDLLRDSEKLVPLR